MSELNSNSEENVDNESPIATKFVAIMQDFVGDMLTTFPEYGETLDIRLRKLIDDNDDQLLPQLPRHCLNS